MENNKKGTATNNEGLGSTYSGTQSPDPNAPDAYQKPTPKQQAADENKQTEADHELGEEYDSPSSYGEKRDEDGPDDTSSDKDGVAEGSPIR